MKREVNSFRVLPCWLVISWLVFSAGIVFPAVAIAQSPASAPDEIRPICVSTTRAMASPRPISPKRRAVGAHPNRARARVYSCSSWLPFKPRLKRRVFFWLMVKRPFIRRRRSAGGFQGVLDRGARGVRSQKCVVLGSTKQRAKRRQYPGHSLSPERLAPGSGQRTVCLTRAIEQALFQVGACL